MNQNAHNWHPADILAAVQKRGVTLAGIARTHNLGRRTVSQALHSPSYPGEQAIAATLELEARTIWPNRYCKAGIPLHPRIRKQFNAPDGVKTSQKMVGV